MSVQYAMCRRGGLVHIVHKAVDMPRPGLTWKCQRELAAFDPILMEAPGAQPMCRRCLIAKDDTEDLRIYAGRCVDAIKIGCSNQPGLRMLGLKATPLAVIDGGFALERRILDAIGHQPIRGREWFPLDAEADILALLREAS